MLQQCSQNLRFYWIFLSDCLLLEAFRSCEIWPSWHWYKKATCRQLWIQKENLFALCIKCTCKWSLVQLAKTNANTLHVLLLTLTRFCTVSARGGYLRVHVALISPFTNFTALQAKSEDLCLACLKQGWCVILKRKSNNLKYKCLNVLLLFFSINLMLQRRCTA